MNKGKMLGFILLAGGLVVGLIILFVLNAQEGLSGGGRSLGIALGFLVLVLPQWAVGAYMVWQGSREATSAAKANQQRELLNIVKTQGQVAISDLVIEMNSTRDEVEQMLRQLVGMGLFSGYVNWDEGMLYSRQANELRQLTRCENCSGELELAGKGVIRCPYCGTEYFLD
ncbi:MAG: hypothetical protein GY803_21590 [Chloroflexi bacterium]|nr:hypothetical protein [Chloroflexota bacterium]